MEHKCSDCGKTTIGNLPENSNGEKVCPYCGTDTKGNKVKNKFGLFGKRI